MVYLKKQKVPFKQTETHCTHSRMYQHHYEYTLTSTSSMMLYVPTLVFEYDRYLYVAP